MLLPVVAGIVIGVAGALALTRFVKNMLYGVGATDVAIFSAVIAIELAVALLAAYLPGRRATNVDPMTALRHE
jgi:ABC-type lipoprotein release transport system permease subunit